MSDGIGVTTLTTRLTLDDQRRGAAAFSVTNRTGHPLRARLEPVALGETSPTWLALEGEAERPLGVEETVSAVVLVWVPAGVRPGRYGIRLDVASVALPDEEWGRSTESVFEVPAEPIPEPPPPPPPRRPIPWWLIIVVVVAIVAVVALGAFLFLRRPGQIAVPNVVGQDAANAVFILTVACSPTPCLLAEVDNPALPPFSFVFNQDPVGGTMVDIGSRVRIFAVFGGKPIRIADRTVAVPPMIDR